MTGKLMLALALSALLGGAAFAANDEFVRVEMQGQLQNEDGQTWLEANGQQYNLDLGNSRNLLGFADRHDDDFVHASGSLEQTAHGMVIVVNRFEAPSAATNYNQTHRYEQQQPVRERTIIRDHEVDEPVFKLGPLEIND